MSQFQVVPCPHCGANYQLTADYLAQYGGQQSPCHQCNQSFPIPRLGEALIPPALYPQADNPVAYGSPVQVLPYRGVDRNLPTSGLWRDGNRIVAVKGTMFPARCVKCNEPSDGLPRRRNLYWHHPAVFAAVISPLIYIILALVLRKSGAVSVYLCHRHAARRRWIIACAWLCLPLGITLFIVAGNIKELAPVLVVLGIVTLLTGLVGGIIGARIVFPTRIDDKYLWLKGAGPAFVASLPQ